MDNSIALIADNKDELNRQIDLKLKEGYLLKGGMYIDKQDKLNQIMILPNNIDPEITPAGIFKIIIGLAIYAGLLYFIF